VTVGYELRTSLTIARWNLDLLRMRSGDAPEIAIALEELGVVEALVTSLLQRTGEEVDAQSLVPRRPAALAATPFRGFGQPRRARIAERKVSCTGSV
jgi:hypothetical protein